MSDDLARATEAGAHGEVRDGSDPVAPSSGRREQARDKPPIGVALSVLWWSEDGAPDEA